MVERLSVLNTQADFNDIELARDSIHNIRRVSQESINENYDGDNERSFRLSYLRRQFTFQNLDNLFNRYLERIDQAYFSLFLILQIILSTAHFILVFVINEETDTLSTVIPDLTLYSIMGLSSLTILYVNERYLSTKFQLVKVFSFLIFLLIYATDLFIPIYYSKSSIYLHLRPAYIVHILLAIYCFIGAAKDVVVFVLGPIVSVTHILTLAFITYDGYESLWNRLGSDIVYMVCINIVGFYHRWASELIKRRSFLDHRACVQSTLKFKFEKEQEDQLMTSIIPEHIIDKVRKDIIEKIEYFLNMEKLPISDPMDIPYVEEYDNVTILYADIVNYTAMTSQLNVVTLVETLNELFSGFDDASEELKVMRIKFLGDCYYSVAGLPPGPAPNHAEACVELGLRMISIIRLVRQRRKLTIDMRIGIHTGRILSGLIGSRKWQFDIWSNDAYLANKMETAGKPGQIHITQQTYDLLDASKYNIIPSDNGATSPHLEGYNVTTYFVIPYSCEETTESNNFTSQKNKRLSIIGEKHVIEEESDTNSITNGIILNGILRTSASEANLYDYPAQSSKYESLDIQRYKNYSGRRVTPGDIKRRTAFMDNNINRYKILLAETEENIQKEIERMPLTKFDQWIGVKEINPFLLMFGSWEMERRYMQLPDTFFKFYLVIYVILLAATILIQNLNLQQWEWRLWSYYGTLGLVLLILIPLSWLYNNSASSRTKNKKRHKSKILMYLRTISKTITTSSIARTIIYVVLCALFLFCVLEEVTECTSNGTIPNLKSVFTVMIQRTATDEYCVIPWHLSHTLSLTILMSFFFMRVHLWLKLLFSLFIIIFYGISIWNLNYEYYEKHETFNYNMKSEIADMMSLIFLTFSLHLLDRQSDYMNRLDFQWNNKLRIEQSEANTMNKITKILLQNILPSHVTKLYLDVNRTNNVLYTEQEDNVAVIFASITDSPINSVSEKLFLRIVNCIIKEFDHLLNKQTGNHIEKIKATNLTYMAACGLDSVKNNYSYEGPREHVAVTLTKFAVDLVKALKVVCSNQLDCKLRIGISHGKVMGGVVGSKKPLYDIWGDTVNMASRMDSTGIAGKIQVTENTALVLQENDIGCEFREYIFVKGKENKVPTYFVKLDDDDNLVHKTNGTKL
ncbi:hypothetical protein FQR65_LT00965 [Abscondita terminalis]|nr:hypothetical protein FQR65_LT00965 [Abscondita terminalis]